MLTKGRTYQFKSDGDSILLEDYETHEYENIKSDLVYLFEKSQQVRLIPGIVSVRPGDTIECILDSPVVFGVDELYYPQEHTFIYNEQNETILELFPELSREELDIVHRILIPRNLRNEVIDAKALKLLITNFVKQSLAVFARSVYESAKNQIDREIVMKLIFGVYSTDKLIGLSSSRKLIVNNSDSELNVTFLGKIIAWYDYPDVREEESE